MFFHPHAVLLVISHELLSSPAAFIFAIAVYLSVDIPASRTIATPVEGVDTREDQIEALRILSAGNVIMIVLLGAILTLQVGRPPILIHPWDYLPCVTAIL